MLPVETLVAVVVAAREDLLTACRKAFCLETSEKDHPALKRAREQSALFRAATDLKFHTIIVEAATLDEAEQKILELDPAARLGLCFIESRCVSDAAHSPGVLAGAIDNLFARMELNGRETLRTPDSVIVFVPSRDYLQVPFQTSAEYRVRVIPD